VYKLIRTFKHNIIIPVSIISLVVMIGVLYYLPKATMENTLKTTLTLKNSDNLVTHMRIFRAYYTDKILTKIKANTDMRINYDHEKRADTIPLPATTVHDLGELFTKGTNTQIRIYSNYPFPNRKDRKLDKFEKDSLQYFLKHPNKPFSRQETLNGEEVVRYAIPDFLTTQACVNCHNSRPDTPKNDWKLGDIRGAIEIITPITDEMAANKEMEEKILIFIGLNSLFLILYIAYISIHRKKEIEELNKDFETKISEQANQLALTSSIFEHATEGIVICDKNNNIVDVNKTFSNITGYSKEEVVSKPISILKSGKHDKTFYQKMWQHIFKKGYWEGKVINRKKDGTFYEEYLHISAITNQKNEPTHYIAVFTDAKEKEEQESIYNLAHFDSLTKIANRSFFQKRLHHDIAKVNKNEVLALMYIDLDRFKIVNDTLGHAVGDKLLAEVVARIQNILEETDFFARLGGDEFAIFFHVKEGLEIAETKAIQKAEKIIETLNELFIIDDNQLSIGSSIGIAFYPVDADNIDTLMQYADTAMYHSKETGRNRFTLYTEDLAKESQKRYQVEQALRKALKKDKLTSVYQPIISSKNGHILGFEVLSRWEDPTLGHVSPDLFISIAEERGLIAEYTYTLLKRSCKDILEWNRTLNHSFYLSINISPVHFVQQDLVERIKLLLEDIGFAPDLLHLEITEGVLIENQEHLLTTLSKLRGMGIKISIDDFGTGYSSISYLKEYPVDKIKIDRTFVQDVPHDDKNKNICATIASLAHNFGLDIVAEGVETVDNAKFLREIGVDYLQGYLFGKPQTADYWLNFFHKESIQKIVNL